MAKNKYFLFTFFLQVFALDCNAQLFSDTTILKANDFPVKFSAVSDFSAAFSNQNSAFEKKQLPYSSNNNQYNNSFIFNNNSKIYAKVNKEYQDLNYGLVTKLEIESNSGQNRARFDLDEVFIFAQNDFGKVELGNLVAVNQKMKVGPATFARGAGGINGNYLKYVNFPSSNSAVANIKNSAFILVPQSPIGHGGYAQAINNNFNKDRLRIIRTNSFNGAEDAFKINYYTPRIDGLQAGLSYTNSTENSAFASTLFSPIVVNEIYSFAANYTDNLENLGYAISLTAESGKFNKDKNSQMPRNNLNSFDVATTLTYFGFTFGTSFGSWQKSLQAKNGIYSCDYNANLVLTNQNCSQNNNKFDNSYYYTLGLAYQIGHLGASLTALESNFQKNEFQSINFDIDYKIKKNFTTYLEVAKFQFKSNKVKALDVVNKEIFDNKGFVVLTGFLYYF